MSDRKNDRVARPAHLRLTLLILEGYAYLGIIVAIFLAAPGFLVWGVLTRRPFIAIVAILVGIPVAATAARVLRALRLVILERKGVPVGPDFGARLYRDVQEIAKRIGAPRIHRVIVTDTYNASAMQIPRVGVFWPTNTLAIGYPLLATLPADTIRAVIAHELGHITHAHGRFSGWVHRTRLSWIRLMEILERHQSVPAHVYLLFRFYVPRLQALSAAVSRQQEWLADRLAGEVAGPEVAAQALTAIAGGQLLMSDVFWPRIFARVDAEPDPPGPFSLLGPSLWDAVENRALFIDHLLEGGTAPSDTHPALRDRLEALGQPPRWPEPVQMAAADHFFGSEKAELVAALDGPWQEDRGDEWRERHEETRTRRDRLAQLAALPSPTPEETFERGVLIEHEENEDAALELYLSAHRHGHAAAAVAAGRLLLDRQDESGIALIESAMNADASLVENGCRIVGQFLEGRGRQVEAFRYHRRMTKAAAMASMARTERSELSTVDRLRACSDRDVDVAALRRRLAHEPGVLRAFLAAKDLRYSSGSQVVLAVLTKNGRAPELGDRLRRDGLLPATITVVALGRNDQHLEAALDAVPGAKLLDTAGS